MSTCRETTIPRRTEVSPLFVSSKLGVAGVAMAILTTHLATDGYRLTMGYPWVTHGLPIFSLSLRTQDKKDAEMCVQVSWYVISNRFQ